MVENFVKFVISDMNLRAMKQFGDMDSFFCINIVQSVKSWTQVTCVREHTLKQLSYLNGYKS